MNDLQQLDDRSTFAFTDTATAVERPRRRRLSPLSPGRSVLVTNGFPCPDQVLNVAMFFLGHLGGQAPEPRLGLVNEC